MEVTHVREENKKLTKQMSDMRGKLADLEARVSNIRSYFILYSALGDTCVDYDHDS